MGRLFFQFNGKMKLDWCFIWENTFNLVDSWEHEKIDTIVQRKWMMYDKLFSISGLIVFLLHPTVNIYIYISVFFKTSASLPIVNRWGYNLNDSDLRKVDPTWIWPLFNHVMCSTLYNHTQTSWTFEEVGFILNKEETNKKGLVVDTKWKREIWEIKRNWLFNQLN